MNTPGFNYGELDYSNVVNAIKGKEEDSQNWQLLFKVKDANHLSDELRKLVGLES